MSPQNVGSLCLAIFVAASAAFAQAPSTISFQGRLTDSGGTPINNASQTIKFALYKGSTKIWEETQSVNVANGIYNVQLGAVVPVDTIKFNAPIDLGVKVGTDAEMTPRTPLVAAAFARGLPGLTTYIDGLSETVGYNLLGGHEGNRIAPNSFGSIVLGGGADLEGFHNEATSSFAVVVGGSANRAGYQGAVVGGIGNRADGPESFVGGGNSNRATNIYDVAVGGLFNKATGGYSTVLGGEHNHAANSYSFAGGYNAHAHHVGSFVWADRSKTLFMDSLVSTAANQFIVRAAGGVGINRAPVSLGIHLKQQASGSAYGIRTEYWDDSDFWDTYVDGANDYNFAYNNSLKAYINDTDGSYNVFSDAGLKEDIQEYGSALDAITSIHPSTYRFKNAPAASPRSLGFIAQEVQPVFPELVSEKDGLLALNYSGLSVVAIKALQEMYAELRVLRSQVARQQEEISELRRQNAR